MFVEKLIGKSRLFSQTDIYGIFNKFVIKMPKTKQISVYHFIVVLLILNYIMPKI